MFFVRALAGLVREKASIAALDVDISESTSRLGMALGGGADFPMRRSLAIRLQGDYLWHAVDGGAVSGVRVSAGLVYRLGRGP